MTPLELEILLHYSYRQGDFNGGDFTDKATCTAIRYLSESSGAWTISGMLREVSEPMPGKGKYELAQKGRVFVEDGLCALKPPTQVWVMPKNDEI
jgi:hypothetical protein